MQEDKKKTHTINKVGLMSVHVWRSFSLFLSPDIWQFKLQEKGTIRSCYTKKTKTKSSSVAVMALSLIAWQNNCLKTVKNCYLLLFSVISVCSIQESASDRWTYLMLLLFPFVCLCIFLTNILNTYIYIYILLQPDACHKIKTKWKQDINYDRIKSRSLYERFLC